MLVATLGCVSTIDGVVRLYLSTGFVGHLWPKIPFLCALEPLPFLFPLLRRQERGGGGGRTAPVRLYGDNIWPVKAWAVLLNRAGGKYPARCHSPEQRD